VGVLGAYDQGGTMLVATFNATTGWAARQITWQDERFILEDHGVITAADVMAYDGQGQLDWPSEEMRGWAAARLSWELGRTQSPVSIEEATDSTGTAIDLIRASEIAQGLELLRRACRARPGDIDVWTVAAFEFALRPNDSGDEHLANEEAQKYYSGLARLAPDSCEYNSIATMHNHLNDPEEALAAFAKASATKPRSEYGATLFMLADIVHSELQFAILATPIGGDLNNRLITWRLKGCVGLIMREHEMALESFRNGASEAEASVEMAIERAGVLAESDKHRVAAGIRLDCRRGEGLVLMDRGEGADARVVFDAAYAEYRAAVSPVG
jgi:hypothetical protein